MARLADGLPASESEVYSFKWRMHENEGCHAKEQPAWN